MALPFFCTFQPVIVNFRNDRFRIVVDVIVKSGPPLSHFLQKPPLFTLAFRPIYLLDRVFSFT